MPKIYFLFSSFLGAFLLCTPLQAQTFKTIGYLPYYRFSLVDDIAFEKLTHLNIAFANPDSEGNLSVGNQAIDPIIAIGHAYELEVYISLAGGLTSDWVTNWANLLQPANRTAFIHKIVNFTIEHDFQGVDMDLEWSNVTENYSGFVLELKDSLANHQLGFTAALPGSYRYPNISADALAVFDWINMMVYDHTGPWAPDSPGQHSSYQHAVNAIQYWSVTQGVSVDRLTLGVPFYGYDFTNSNNVHSFTYGSMVAQDPAYADEDEVGLAFYNGRPTIEAKTDLALAQVSGIMIWELGQDALGVNEAYSLLEVIYQQVLSAFVNTSTPDDVLSPLVYPNPFQQDLYIDDIGNREVNIQLRSIEGRLLYEANIQKGQLNTQIPTALFNKGFYFLTISSGEKRQVYKLVKN